MRVKNYIISLLLLVLASCKVQGQEISKQDTNLYLFFDSERFPKYDTKAIIPKTLEERWEIWFIFHGIRLYDAYPLEFLSIDKRSAKTITYYELKKLPVFTIDQLHKFISENYRGSESFGYYGSTYFNNLKHIYLVEKDEKTKTATITEVKLNITLE